MKAAWKGKGCRQKDSCRRPAINRVVCGEDITAIGLMKEFKERGYRVPEDIAITGCNNSPDSRICEPELTTLDNKPELLGGMCASLLRDRMEERSRPQAWPSSPSWWCAVLRYSERLGKTARIVPVPGHIRRPAGVQPYNTEQGLV